MSYRSVEGYNQSLIKKILAIPSDENEKAIPGVRKHINLGSTVDLMLSYDNFDDYIYVYNGNEPSETITKIVNNAYANDSTISDNSLEQAIILCNYIGNQAWDMSRKIDEIRKKGEEYINFIFDSESKLIVSQKQYEQARAIKGTIETSTNTREFFNTPCNRQEEIYLTYNELPLKAALDRVIIRENELQPIDYKVTDSHLTQWLFIAKKFRYDLQAAFYTFMLQLKYPDKKILPFKFIVASSNPNVQPYVYTVSDNDLHVGRYGMDIKKEVIINKRIVEYKYHLSGFEDGLNIIKESLSLGLDDYDIESYKNGRSKLLNLWTT